MVEHESRYHNQEHTQQDKILYAFYVLSMSQNRLKPVFSSDRRAINFRLSGSLKQVITACGFHFANAFIQTEEIFFVKKLVEII